MSDLQNALQQQHIDDEAQATLAAQIDEVPAFLTHEEATLRSLAADALGRSGGVGAVEGLITALAADDDPAVRGHIGQALTRLAERHPAVQPQVFDALTPLLVDADMWLRVAIGEAMADLAQRERAAADACTRPMLDALLMVEKQVAYDLTLDALIGIGANAIPALSGCLRAEDAAIQKQAAYTLEQIGKAHPETAPQVHAALKAWKS